MNLLATQKQRVKKKGRTEHRSPYSGFPISVGGYLQTATNADHTVYEASPDSDHLVYLPSPDSDHLVYLPSPDSDHRVYLPSPDSGHLVYLPSQAE